MERLAGWTLLGGSALVIVAIAIYVSGGNNEPVLALGLIVTLSGLIAFTDVLGKGGEQGIPRLGIAAFTIGTISWIVSDALNTAYFELETVYTLLACLTIALFGWSILRTKALSNAIGWFAIAWAIIDAFGYLSRLITPPLGPNLAMIVFGLALVLPRHSRAAA